jgi:hypothetical protein
MPIRFGGCAMHFLVTFILVALMSVGFFAASAGAEEVRTLHPPTI